METRIWRSRDWHPTLLAKSATKTDRAWDWWQDRAAFSFAAAGTCGALSPAAGPQRFRRSFTPSRIFPSSLNTEITQSLFHAFPDTNIRVEFVDGLHLFQGF